MDASNKNFKLHYHKAKFGCTLVALSIPCQASWFVLNKLRIDEPCSCPQLAHNSENTALLYAIFLWIQVKLTGDVGALEASEATSVGCSYQNGQFTIYAQTNSKMSTVGRVLKTMIACCAPEKLWKLYSHNIRQLNGKPDKEEFYYCCSEVRKACANLQGLILGKVAIKAPNLQKLHASAYKKYATPTKKVPMGKKPQSLTQSPGETCHPTLSVSGIPAHLLSQYIKSKDRVNTNVMSDTLIVYKDMWKSKPDKDHINHWLKPLSKPKDLNATLVYSAINAGHLDAKSAVTALHKKFDTETLAKEILKALS